MATTAPHRNPPVPNDAQEFVFAGAAWRRPVVRGLGLVAVGIALVWLAVVVAGLQGFRAGDPLHLFAAHRHRGDHLLLTPHHGGTPGAITVSATPARTATAPPRQNA